MRSRLDEPRYLHALLVQVATAGMMVACDVDVPTTPDTDETDGATVVPDTVDTEVGVESDTDGVVATDTDVMVDSDTDGDTDTDGVSATDSDTDTDGFSATDTDTDTDTDGFSGTDSDTDTDGISATDSDTDTDGIIATDTDTDTDTVVITATDTDTDTDVFADTDTDTDLTADSDTDFILDSDGDTWRPIDSGETGDSDRPPLVLEDSDTDPCNIHPRTLVPADTGELAAAGYGVDDALRLGGCDFPPGNGFVSLCDASAATPDQFELLDGVNPLYPVAYVQLITRRRPDYVDGVPCDGAPDMAACLAALEAVTQAGGGSDTADTGDTGDTGGGSTDESMVTTAGGVVEVYRTPTEALTWLGDVDTEMEAMMVAWLTWGSMSGYLYNDHPWSCFPGEGGVRRVPGGFELIEVDLANECPIVNHRFRVFVDAQGNVVERERQVLSLDPRTCIGRRPPGLCDADVVRTTRGAVLARHAALEAASVVAFTHLARELVALEAPASLVEACHKAARDETRHAAQVGRLARRFGVEPETAVVVPSPLRTAEAIALDNAVEGCVGETWGALVGMVQGRTATDPVVASTMRRVARDEARHAALSWQLHHWLMGQLDGAAQTRVRAALAEAVAERRTDVAVGDAVLGWPDAERQEALWRELEPVLLAA